jgi:2-polyprenyl-3-methyl-5-hydroxy-6-metoxy-1,4-benzoquinol methylase
MSRIGSEIWDRRELYEQTPDRYSQIPKISGVRRIIQQGAEKWRESRGPLLYADIGCGAGHGAMVFSEFLQSQTGLSVDKYGVDASSECAPQCRALGINYSVVDIGTSALPFKNVQVITLFETIEHIFNTDFLLKSIRDSISPDGLLFVTTLNVVCLKNRILVPLGIQPMNTEVSTEKLSYGYRLGTLKRRVEAWKPAGHIRPFTLYSLCDILADNRFAIVKTFGLENWKALKFLEKVSKNNCTGMLVVARPK